MKAVVVYESYWGNTRAIAQAVAEGLGEGAVALHTDEATVAALEGAELIVAGAPLLGFSLPNDQIRKGLPAETSKGGPEPDMSHPTLRSWIDALPKGNGRSATFETRIWWSPGSAAKSAGKLLAAKGFTSVGSERFLVTGRYGPLKDGEVDRARAWGASLR